MIETLKRGWHAQAAVILLIALTIWWFMNSSGPNAYEARYFGDFPSIYGVMALWGGLWGIVIAQQWGGIQSIMGKAILMFSLGLFAQALGQIIYAYYSFFLNVSVPYPSWGDVGYFGSIPLYTYGVWLLGKASGIKIGLESAFSKVQAIIIPAAMLIFAYFFFMQGYEFDASNPIKIFLDFGYPFGQAIYVSLALLTYLLSRKVLGGVMKNKILFILFALLFQFLCDYTFLYQASRGIWTAGGINDYMFLISYFLMTIGLIQLHVVARELKK